MVVSQSVKESFHPARLTFFTRTTEPTGSPENAGIVREMLHSPAPESLIAPLVPVLPRMILEPITGVDASTGAAVITPYGFQFPLVGAVNTVPDAVLSMRQRSSVSPEPLNETEYEPPASTITFGKLYVRR